MAVTIKGDGVQFDDGSFQTRAAALQNRNMIVNGAMAVSQENGEGSLVISASDTYLADQWLSVNTTGTGTVTATTETLNGSKSKRLTATAAVTDLTGSKFVYGFFQRLEAQNVFHLNSKTVNVSFRCKTNWTGLLPICVRNPNDTRSYVVDVPVTSGENYVSVSIPLEAATIPTNDNARGLTLAIGFCNEDVLRTATTGSWLAGNFLTSTNSTQWAKITGNYVEVTQVQLEEGDVATPFEHRKYSDYLTECQRYFWCPNPTGQLQLCSSINSQAYRERFRYQTEMRVAPTITIQNYLDAGGSDVTSNYSADSITSHEFLVRGAASATTARIYTTLPAYFNARL